MQFLLVVSFIICNIAVESLTRPRSSKGPAYIEGSKGLRKVMKTNEVKVMDARDMYAAAAEILKKYDTISEVKKHGAEMLEKYGRENWRGIFASIKDIRVKEIDSAADACRAGVRDWSDALDNAFKAADNRGKFSTLTSFVRGNYATAAEFVAAWYPHTIDGKPAQLVSYIDDKGKTIYTAYQPANYDGRQAYAVMDKCIGTLNAAGTKASRRAADAAPVHIDNVRAAGVVVGVYNVEFADDGSAHRDTRHPISAKQAAKLLAAVNASGGVRDFLKLSEVNAEARKASKNASK